MVFKSSKIFFLVSFLPALAYWYLEENYPIQIAVTGGIALAIFEILFERFYTKHIHTLSKFNFFLISFLGGLSLIGNEGIWFKLQPGLTGVGIGAFLFYRLFTSEGLMNEIIQSIHKNPPPEFIIKRLEKHSATLFTFYGFFMIYVAFSLSTDQWLFFKTLGFYIAFGFFMIFEFCWIRISMKEWVENQRKWDTIKRW